MKLTKNKIYTIILVIIFVLFFVFRINNAVNYNCYWGYDGAKHIEYVDVVQDQHRLPNMQENYLAWHEPFYYFVFAVFGSIYKFITGNLEFFSMIKFLQILSAVIDVFFLFVFYQTLKLLTPNKNIQLASLISVGFFTPLILVNNYLTNELFLFWLIITIFYFVVKFEQRGWNIKKIFLVAILSALALLTKLSALIFILSFIIWLLYKMIYFWIPDQARDDKKRKENKRTLLYLIIFVLTVVILNLPWQIYRQQQFGSALTINNYELLNAHALNQEQKIDKNFFLNIDFKIFNNPFWQTGRNSFWSMLWAQNFVDYDNISGNVDLNNVQQQIMTGNGRYLSHQKFKDSILMLYVSIFVVLIFVLGYLSQVVKWIKNKFKPDFKLLLLIFITGSVTALAYNVIKYPFLERGTLKTIFVLSAWPWLFYLGYTWLNKFFVKIKQPYWWLIAWLIIVCYVFLSLKINWIP